MDTSNKSYSPDGWRGTSSPRPKARENAKDTICRNVTIYGHCRYEEKGCAFNHDPMKSQIPQTHADSLRKRLNVDSPTFTPSSLAGNSRSGTPKNSIISPKAASAAPFTPKGVATPPQRPEPDQSHWAAAEAQEFVPQTYEPIPTNDGAETAPYLAITNAANVTLAAIGTPQTPVQVNPYAPENMGPGYYPGQAAFPQTGFSQPLQYHLYAPIGPHRENLLPHQRHAHDFFISDMLREEIQREVEASTQVLPNSTLPAQVDNFHSLVPLDTTNQKNAATFGYPTWIYKAVSSKDGKLYALRRLEGYRLTNERSVRAVQQWKHVDSASVVAVHDAFTTGAFGDRSLVFVTDYHPMSKTLLDHHAGPMARFTGRAVGPLIPETVLWGYMVQIASALKVIFAHVLAARMIDPSKILLTGKNRIRLNACAILDVVQFETGRTMPEVQQEDLVRFGRLILSLAANNPAHLVGLPAGIEHLPRSYSPAFKECVGWLLAPASGSSVKSIEHFLQGIAGQVISSYDSLLHQNDHYHTELAREIENGRLVRLMAKLGMINERPEFEHDRQWSDTGDRYFLKLFRDHVFHSVDSQGRAVVDLGHILTCLAKLDTGVDEKLSLISRDEQNVLVVSYRELKRGMETAFQDLVRASRRS